MGAYPQAMVVTLAIEVPIYVTTLGPLARAFGGSMLSWSRALVLGGLVNLVSHPLAFVVFFPLLRQLTGRTAALVLVEVGVLVLEAAILARWLKDGTVALIASSLANVTSLTLGALLVG